MANNMETVTIWDKTHQLLPGKDSCRPVINHPHPFNGDYNKDPNVTAPSEEEWAYSSRVPKP